MCPVIANPEGTVTFGGRSLRSMVANRIQMKKYSFSNRLLRLWQNTRPTGNGFVRIGWRKGKETSSKNRIATKFHREIHIEIFFAPPWTSNQPKYWRNTLCVVFPEPLQKSKYNKRKLTLSENRNWRWLKFYTKSLLVDKLSHRPRPRPAVSRESDEPTTATRAKLPSEILYDFWYSKFECIGVVFKRSSSRQIWAPLQSPSWISLLINIWIKVVGTHLI